MTKIPLRIIIFLATNFIEIGNLETRNENSPKSVYVHYPEPILKKGNERKPFGNGRPTSYPIQPPTTLIFPTSPKDFKGKAEHGSTLKYMHLISGGFNTSTKMSPKRGFPPEDDHHNDDSVKSSEKGGNVSHRECCILIEHQHRYTGRNKREVLMLTEKWAENATQPHLGENGDPLSESQGEKRGIQTASLFDAVNTTANLSAMCNAIYSKSPNSTSSSTTMMANDSTSRSVIFCPETQIDNIWEKGALSSDQFKRIRTASRWASIILPLPGLPLATLSAIVFSKKRMKSRVSGLVMTFNICEGLKITWLISLRFWRQLLGNSMITWSSMYANFFLFASTWIPTCFGRISLLANMLVSFDRFVKLVFPLKSFTLKIIAYPKLAVAMCVIFPVVINSFLLFLTLMFIMPKLDTSAEFTADEITSMIALTDPGVFGIYQKFLIVSSICFRYIPLVISITLSLVAVVSVVHQQRKCRKATISTTAAAKRNSNSTRMRNKTRQNNTMIVATTLLFSLLVSIKPLVRVFSSLHPTIGQGKQELYVYLILNEFAVFVDNLVPILNFVAYVTLSSYFRMSLRDMFEYTRH